MQCLSPISIPRPNGAGAGDRLTVPCGRCASCLSRKRNEWTYRVMQEYKHCDSSFFVTLTYSEENLPYNENNVASVSKRDIQLFFKRLRKTQKQQVRYYLSSEYGPKTKRPHYHAIVFNVIDPENIVKSWDKGFCRLDPVNDARIAYTTKYCITKARYPDKANKVFSLMSRRPAIGFMYLHTHAEIHMRDPDRMYCILPGGKKQPLPRYYKNKLYSEVDRANYAEKCIINSEEKEVQKLKKFKQNNSTKNFYEYDYEQKNQFIKQVEQSTDKSIL